MKKFPIITLCGSTKFKSDFIKVQKELTLKGYVVISVGLFGHSGDNEVWTEGTKQMLDDMHKYKIDLADEIFVINKNGYIGESTKSEIEYAKSKGKKINYLEPIQKNNIPKNIDDVMIYMEETYGIKLYNYQKEILRTMWRKEYIKNLVIPRHANIATYNLINIYKILLGDKN